MSGGSAEALWAEFAGAEVVNDDFAAWTFGPGDDATLATKLAVIVRDGPKRATTSLLLDYEEKSEPLPRAGDYSVVLDGARTAV